MFEMVMLWKECLHGGFYGNLVMMGASLSDKHRLNGAFRTVFFGVF